MPAHPFDGETRIDRRVPERRNDSAMRAPWARLERGAGEAWVLVLSGDWTLQAKPPPRSAMLRQLPESGATLTFDSEGLGRWGSPLLLFVEALARAARERGLHLQDDGLPEGVRRLLHLARSTPQQAGIPARSPAGILYRVGILVLTQIADTRAVLGFVGGAVLALPRAFTGRARFRGSDLAQLLQDAGADSLPIVGLLSFLIGMVLAFVGAVQLAQFGAQVYVADLVAIGMTREMGAMMTAIVMAGRVGAAYAAHLGTMQVNEEIDALRTLGIPPLEFLALPRLLALTLMLPLLCMYSDLVGILGGMLVAGSLFDIGMTQYLEQTRLAIDLTDFFLGLFKAMVFGSLVATASCFEGLRCGRSSAAVGTATTRAVVLSIVSIIVADTIMTVITHVLDI